MGKRTRKKPESGDIDIIFPPAEIPPAEPYHCDHKLTEQTEIVTRGALGQGKGWVYSQWFYHCREHNKDGFFKILQVD